MLIYIISFIESFCTGLHTINFVLYLKYVLKLTEYQTGWFLSAFGLTSALFIFWFGPFIDKYGVKTCAIVGSSLLAFSRLGNGLTSTLPLASVFFILGSAGAAIKASAIIVYLKQYNKSFKLDYGILNLAYFFSGIVFDEIHNYQYIYLLSGSINLINLILLMNLPVVEKAITVVKSINWQVLKRVLIYNFMVLPVSCIFIWMNNGLPKWLLAVLGPNTPIGKIDGSLNPFIILLTLPLFKLVTGVYNRTVSTYIFVGSLLSASAMFIPMLPGNYFYLVLASIALFTIGEAIWSPSNMELSAKICPEGEEGRYMTLALIPSMLGKILMGGIIAFSMTHFIESPSKHYSYPFVIIGLIALLTPALLYLNQRYKLVDIQ